MLGFLAAFGVAAGFSPFSTRTSTSLPIKSLSFSCVIFVRSELRVCQRLSFFARGTSSGRFCAA